MVKVLPFTGQTGGRGPGNGDLPDTEAGAGYSLIRWVS